MGQVCQKCAGAKRVYEKLRNGGTLNYVEHILTCDMCDGKWYIDEKDREWQRHREGLVPHPNY
jgi:hypothetical protein